MAKKKLKSLPICKRLTISWSKTSKGDMVEVDTAVGPLTRLHTTSQLIRSPKNQSTHTRPTSMAKRSRLKSDPVITTATDTIVHTTQLEVELAAWDVVSAASFVAVFHASSVSCAKTVLSSKLEAMDTDLVATPPTTAIKSIRKRRSTSKRVMNTKTLTTMDTTTNSSHLCIKTQPWACLQERTNNPVCSTTKCKTQAPLLTVNLPSTESSSHRLRN